MIKMFLNVSIFVLYNRILYKIYTRIETSKYKNVLNKSIFVLFRIYQIKMF
jgi:hypothetical protein